MWLPNHLSQRLMYKGHVLNVEIFDGEEKGTGEINCENYCSDETQHTLLGLLLRDITALRYFDFK